MTYKSYPAGVPPNHLKLNKCATVSVIPKILHAYKVNKMIFVVKEHTIRVVGIASVDQMVDSEKRLF